MNKLDQTTFDQCMNRMRQGDRDALRRIYEAYRTYIYAMILSIVRDRTDAEDLTVDCFLRIWNAASQYRPGEAHKAWLGAIARNLALDHLRKQQRENLLAEALGKTEDIRTGESAEESVLSNMNFQEMVRTLPVIEQQILVLKLEGDLTFREIARVLKLPMTGVTWKYRKALDSLRRMQDRSMTPARRTLK